MAAAPKKTVVVNPAPAAFEAPADARRRWKRRLPSRPRRRFPDRVAGQFALRRRKGSFRVARGLRQSEDRGGRDRQRVRKQLRPRQGGRVRDQRQGPRGPARQHRSQLRFHQVGVRGQESSPITWRCTASSRANRSKRSPSRPRKSARSHRRSWPKRRRADQGTGRQDLQDRGLRNSSPSGAPPPSRRPARRPVLGRRSLSWVRAGSNDSPARGPCNAPGFDSSFPAVAVRAAIAQLVRALDCGSRGPPFEPGWRYHRDATRFGRVRESRSPNSPRARSRAAHCPYRRADIFVASRWFPFHQTTFRARARDRRPRLAR